MSERDRETWADRMQPAPERTFGNPFAAWHYRTLDRSMYFTDVDGVEVVGTYPVILYEVKTIKASLFNAIMRNEEHTNPQIAADFFGRFNMWQIAALSRLIKPGLQQGLMVVTPTNCEAFWVMPFDWIREHLGPKGDVRQCLNNGTTLLDASTLIRSHFATPQIVAWTLQDARQHFAEKWRWAERNDVVMTQ